MKRLDPERSAERRRMYDEGKSDRQIAKAQGVTRESVLYWRRQHSLPSKWVDPREGEA